MGDAEDITVVLADDHAVVRSGLREYYDPRDGSGQGAHEFTWSALIAELATCRYLENATNVLLIGPPSHG